MTRARKCSVEKIVNFYLLKRGVMIFPACKIQAFKACIRFWGHFVLGCIGKFPDRTCRDLFNNHAGDTEGHYPQAS